MPRVGTEVFLRNTVVAKLGFCKHFYPNSCCVRNLVSSALTVHQQVFFTVQYYGISTIKSRKCWDTHRE